MNVIAWNRSGAIKPSFVNNFHDIVKKHKPYLFYVANMHYKDPNG